MGGDSENSVRQRRCLASRSGASGSIAILAQTGGLDGRMLLARAMVPLAGNQPLVQAIQQHGQALFGEPIPAVGTPLYTDVRLYVERGIPGVIYGAGPRTVRESHAKRADERIDLEDLRRATKVIARMLSDLC